MTKQLIRLGHSPDPDDAFMFYGLACGAVDCGDFEFEHVLRDIQTLNDWAARGKLEVTAISVHAYPHVQDTYAILSSGASMGATSLTRYEYDPQFSPDKSIFANAPLSEKHSVHGPVLIAKEPFTLDEVAEKVIAVPGTMTSAFLALSLVLGRPFEYLVMMFDEIIDAVRQGKVDAGLVIHEAQLTYHHTGLHCLIDLGQWWHQQTSLPLPLGCNVIRRDLNSEAISRISKILKASIEYGLNHRADAVNYALKFGRGLDKNTADRFIGMYVNEWTLDCGPIGRRAIAELFRQAHQANMVSKVEKLEFV